MLTDAFCYENQRSVLNESYEEKSKDIHAGTSDLQKIDKGIQFVCSNKRNFTNSQVQNDKATKTPNIGNLDAISQKLAPLIRKKAIENSTVLR